MLTCGCLISQQMGQLLGIAQRIVVVETGETAKNSIQMAPPTPA
jgi:hypothetical protein